MGDLGAVLRLEGVTKTYDPGTPAAVEVLHGIDVRLERQEFVALVGPSGAGKSTLLNIIGLLDRPTSGRLLIGEDDTSALDDTALTQLRSHRIGFVFQQHFLLSAFTALENVMMPMLIERRFRSADMRTRAMELLTAVGLGARAESPVQTLSGGEQQRVAVARALAMHPALVLADEPTGNLDTASADVVFALMRKANAESGTTFLVVTHNAELAARCDRIIEVVDGRVVPGAVTGG